MDSSKISFKGMFNVDIGMISGIRIMGIQSIDGSSPSCEACHWIDSMQHERKISSSGWWKSIAFLVWSLVCVFFPLEFCSGTDCTLPTIQVRNLWLPFGWDTERFEAFLMVTLWWVFWTWRMQWVHAPNFCLLLHFSVWLCPYPWQKYLWIWIYFSEWTSV